MKAINLKLMLVVLFALFAFACGYLGGVPPDKTMEEKFRLHEADFNKLIMMIKEDKLLELTSEAAYLAPSDNNERGIKTELSAERMKEYRRLLRLAGARRVAAGKDQVFYLYVFEGDTGWIFSDYQIKSYVYSEIPRSPLVDSLDRKSDLPNVDYLISAYKKIGNKWYLNFQGEKDISVF